MCDAKKATKIFKNAYNLLKQFSDSPAFRQAGRKQISLEFDELSWMTEALSK